MIDMNEQNNGIVFQSNLGERADNKNESQRTWNSGFLAFGKITKIHHKSNTAEVRLYGTGDTITSMDEYEGIHACRIGVNSAGVRQGDGVPYGEIKPLEIGMIVLVAFIRNNKRQPVILCAFHDTESENSNILTRTYPLESEREMYRYTRITRLQDVFTIDGGGNLEISTHGKSFITLTDSGFDPDSFDYKDLSTKSKLTGETVGLPRNSCPDHAFLAVMRGYDDDESQIRLHATPKRLQIKRKNGHSESVLIGDGIELSTGTTAKIKISPDGSISIVGGSVSVTAQRVTLNADTSVMGNLSVSGNISIGGDENVSGTSTIGSDAVVNGVSMINHTHTGFHGETGTPH